MIEFFSLKLFDINIFDSNVFLNKSNFSWGDERRYEVVVLLFVIFSMRFEKRDFRVFMSLQELKIINVRQIYDDGVVI